MNNKEYVEALLEKVNKMLDDEIYKKYCYFKNEIRKIQLEEEYFVSSVQTMRKLDLIDEFEKFLANEVLKDER